MEQPWRFAVKEKQNAREHDLQYDYSRGHSGYRDLPQPAYGYEHGEYPFKRMGVGRLHLKTDTFQGSTSTYVDIGANARSQERKTSIQVELIRRTMRAHRINRRNNT